MSSDRSTPSSASSDPQTTLNTERGHEDIASATPSDPVTATKGASTAETAWRYTPMRLHAQGGLGRVWLARDGELGREVALKELRPERADHPELRRRFLEEAKITGQLEHPGIVPVYELATHPEYGQPFYTMRFIQGRTLAEAVRDYHHRRSNGQAGPLELQALLSAFLAVCNAVAYAHSRGVLHRDLKGQNIVLGEFGEALVLDWGLAKLVDRPEQENDTPAIVLDAEERRQQTEQGQLLGTPSNMAPEQAAGELDRIDRRTDVYGLGSVLYEVLTGQPPFAGANSREVVRKVLQEEPMRPRQRVRSTPRALEAVCLKALAKEREQRYDSAKDLAEEIRRFLADEPVSAYPEPLPQRLGRWGRRHKALTAGTAALLLTALFASIVGLAAVNRERQRTQAALLAEQKASERERESLQEVARLDNQLGAHLANISPDAEAENLLRQALAIAEKLAAEHPARADYQERLALTCGNLGSMLVKAQRQAEAIPYYQQSVSVLDQLIAQDPASVAYRRQLALAQQNLGLALRRNRRFAEAEKSLSRAVALQDQLVAEHPAVADHRRELAKSHREWGELSAARGQWPRAESEYRRALRLQEELSTEFPKTADYLEDLARSLSQFGLVSANARRYREAESAWQRSLRLLDKLPATVAAKPDNRYARAFNLFNLGTLHAAGNRFTEVESDFRRALETWEKLVDDYPARLDYRKELARAFLQQGGALRMARKSAEAEKSFRRAGEIARRLVQDHSSDAEYHSLLGIANQYLGESLFARGELAEALNCFRRAAENQQTAAKADTADRSYRNWLASAYRGQIASLLRLGRHADLAKLADDAPESFSEKEKIAFNRACILSLCVRMAEKDSGLSETKRKELAGHYGDRAIAALRQAIAQGFRDGEQMKKEKDLDPLRTREDFRKILADLAAKK